VSERDRRLAEKYAKKGKVSATETRRAKEEARQAKEAERKGRGGPGSGGIVGALRGFDSSNAKETAVPASEASKARARAHKFRLPRLG